MRTYHKSLYKKENAFVQNKIIFTKLRDLWYNYIHIVISGST